MKPNTPTKPVTFYQSSKRIHPKWVMGQQTSVRLGLLLLGQCVFLGLPWLQWDGRQAVLFDLSQAQFFVFTWVLAVHELVYLSGIVLLSAVGLFWCSALSGRVWCGHACPQTLYSTIMIGFDHVFEGDRLERLKLEQAPWSARKIRIKTCKYMVILFFCLWTGLTFVGWFSPIRALWQNVWLGNLNHAVSTALLLYAGATWLLAHVLREQVCVYMCPYARFQSAMTDKNTLTITYDALRGEPRKQIPHQAHGACVNCQQCVHVCPTGIDIRNGLQYACIGCAACIDACNAVMDKTQQTRGLIRYARQTTNPSYSSWRSSRVWVYTLTMLATVSLMAYQFNTRPVLQAQLSPSRQVLFRYNAQGDVENVYQLRLHNPSPNPLEIQIDIEGLPQATLHGIPSYWQLQAWQKHTQIFHISTPTQALAHTTPITVFVRYRDSTQNQWHVLSQQTHFIGPAP